MQLKTNEEVYQEYMDHIEDLENEISGIEFKKTLLEVDIEQKQKRIDVLKRTADSYLPQEEKQINNVTINFSLSDLSLSKQQAEEFVKQLSKQLSTTVRTKGIR